MTNGNYPFIEITVSEDKMQAHMSIVSSGEEELEITSECLLSRLEGKGISFGIKKVYIDQIIEKWKRNRKILNDMLVAEGKPPASRKKNDVSLAVKGIEKQTILDKLNNLEFKHFTALRGLCPFDMVEAGTVILRAKIEAGEYGVDVFGDMVNPAEDVDLKVTVGKNIIFDEKKGEFLAEKKGVAVFIDNLLEVEQVFFDGHIDIELSKDGMEASAVIFPGYLDESNVTLPDVIEALNESGVKTGILEKEIDACLQKVSESKNVQKAVVARGTPAQNGEDGRVEHFIEFVESLKPKEMEDGTVDFKNVSVIKAVGKYEKLAKLHQPGKGKPGFDLFGNPVPAQDGREIRMPVGNNTEISAHDSSILVSSLSGNARLNHNLIEVTECYVVNNDVDYSTGNITYPKTLLIKGDVKAGFELDVGQEIEVHGLVEDCKIKAGGKVLVRSGFIGTGSGIIEGSDDVGLGYVRNQTVRCRKTIAIAGETINCQLYARGSIEVGGRKIGIIGGNTYARREIICITAGNETGVKTQLEVGTDFALVEEKYNTEEKLKELSVSKIKINEHLNKLAKLKQIKKVLQEKEAYLLKKLIEMQIKVNAQLAALEERKALILEKLSKIGNARIFVKRKVFPGVSIKIGDNILNIDQELDGPKTYFLGKGTIKQS